MYLLKYKNPYIYTFMQATYCSLIDYKICYNVRRTMYDVHCTSYTSALCLYVMQPLDYIISPITNDLDP